MGNVVDWTGVRQGRLYITRRMGSRQDGQATWECVCECGTRCVKSSGSLRSGVKSCTTKCGVATSNRRRAKHGLAASKEYRAWTAAKQRCLNPNNPNYKNYGARGITMHPDWVDNFAAFYAHIGPAPGKARHVSIDRIDTDGNYEPGNVRWVTSVKIQINNRRITRRTTIGTEDVSVSALVEGSDLSYAAIDGRWRKGVRGEALLAPKCEHPTYTIDGVTKTLPAWAAERGVNVPTVRGRMRLGESIEQALDPNIRKPEPYKYKQRPPKAEKVLTRPRKYYTVNGETLTLNGWSDRFGIPYSTLRYRLRTGFTIEEALNLTPRGALCAPHNNPT
jgi:hypothetical protein